MGLRFEDTIPIPMITNSVKAFDHIDPIPSRGSHSSLPFHKFWDSFITSRDDFTPWLVGPSKLTTIFVVVTTPLSFADFDKYFDISCQCEFVTIVLTVSWDPRELGFNFFPLDKVQPGTVLRCFAKIYFSTCTWSPSDISFAQRRARIFATRKFVKISAACRTPSPSHSPTDPPTFFSSKVKTFTKFLFSPPRGNCSRSVSSFQCGWPARSAHIR